MFPSLCTEEISGIVSGLPSVGLPKLILLSDRYHIPHHRAGNQTYKPSTYQPYSQPTHLPTYQPTINQPTSQSATGMRTTLGWRGGAAAICRTMLSASRDTQMKTLPGISISRKSNRLRNILLLKFFTNSAKISFYIFNLSNRILMIIAMAPSVNNIFRSKM